MILTFHRDLPIGFEKIIILRTSMLFTIDYSKNTIIVSDKHINCIHWTVLCCLTLTSVLLFHLLNKPTFKIWILILYLKFSLKYEPEFFIILIITNFESKLEKLLFELIYALHELFSSLDLLSKNAKQSVNWSSKVCYID